MVRVEVINTGTELLLGDVINTHVAFIARAIFSLGLRVDRQVAIPDGAAIQDALVEAFQAADVVFVTGGLGPTTDDITREVTAELLGLPLQKNDEVAAAITARLTKHRFPLTSRVLLQADVPEGAVVLANENGTAPGLYLAPRPQNGRRTPHLFLLPGPPRELHPMFRDSVLPILTHIVPAGQETVCRTFSIACMGESVVEAAIGAKILALGNIELGYCAKAGAVDVRVLGPESTIAEAEKIIRDALPTAIYSSSGETLEQVAVSLLTAKNQTLATAESCTGGFLAHRITNVPGSSAVYLAGDVTYSNEAKSAALGVPAELIREHGAVSEAVAGAMAEGARAKGNAHYALSTTGIAGPSGGSEAKPMGTVFVALASHDRATQVERFRFITDRETFKQLAAQRALEMLRQTLLAS